MNAALATEIEMHRPDIREACARFGVLRLELFGSAASDNFDPQRSDLDFLVAFARTDRMTPFDQYFGLKEYLERLFRRPVDLLEEGAATNPYFLKSLNESRRLLYAA